MRGTIVAVLRGGPDSHHELSLQTGHAFRGALPEDRYTVRDIYIDHEGVWHERGIPTTAERVLRSSDTVLSALHGPFGEGGQMQRLFERSGVPYNGADSYASFASLHKLLAKRHAEELGLKTPRFVYVEPGMDVSNVASEINRSFLQPVVVKPVASGASMGVSQPHGFAPIRSAILDIIERGESVLVEERVRGVDATVTLIEGMRGEELYAPPPVEIIAGGSAVAPGRFTRDVSEALVDAAKQMHLALGLRHYSRVDFIVTPQGIQFLEITTLPAMGKNQAFPQALASVGISIPEFSEHLVMLSLG